MMTSWCRACMRGVHGDDAPANATMPAYQSPFWSSRGLPMASMPPYGSALLRWLSKSAPRPGPGGSRLARADCC